MLSRAYSTQCDNTRTNKYSYHLIISWTKGSREQSSLSLSSFAWAVAISLQFPDADCLRQPQSWWHHYIRIVKKLIEIFISVHSTFSRYSAILCNCVDTHCVLYVFSSITWSRGVKHKPRGAGPAGKDCSPAHWMLWKVWKRAQFFWLLNVFLKLLHVPLPSPPE